MSYNNELYIFSEVPGYDASKGERIVKAFRKLRAKIEHLEQTRMSEKNTSAQNVQANNDPELTITDVQSEILLTQIRYIIKLLRECANDKQPDSEVNKNAFEKEEETVSPSTDNSQFKPAIIEKDKSNQEEYMQIDMNVLEASNTFENDLKSKTSLETQTSLKQYNSTDSDARVPHRPPKLNSQPHYHLKLDDVPFILGASSSASHSVVANVQNIIALMKSHNKALCAPKVQVRSKTASSSYVNKECVTDANEMIREISEGLSTLTQKQKKLEEMFDKLPTNEKVKPEVSLKKENPSESKRKNQPFSNSLSNTHCTLATMNQEKKHPKKKYNEPSEVSQKPSVPAIRMQTNSNPQLARRKMLRSLKDFKIHLSEEDISWE